MLELHGRSGPSRVRNACDALCGFYVDSAAITHVISFRAQDVPVFCFVLLHLPPRLLLTKTLSPLSSFLIIHDNLIQPIS